MVDGELPGLLETYRTLHANPELSFQESRTSALLAQRLRALGYNVTERVGRYEREDLTGFGIVAVMKNGQGPVVMLRTELDALPLKEKTDLAFASRASSLNERGERVDVMHACGHDLHMASLLGAAGILARTKESWRGTLVLLGQPAEETGLGAAAMLRDGLYTRFPRPDYILAFHNNSALEAGQILYFEGYARANVDAVDITVRGVGGHGAAPHTTRDPVVLTAHLILALQTIASREQPPFEPVVVSIGSIEGGNRRNVIPDEVRLELSVRTQSDTARHRVLDSIARMAGGLGRMAGVPEDRLPIVRIRHGESVPAIYNDPGLTDRLVRIWKQTFSDEQVSKGQPLMSSDDFARLALEPRQIPLCMFAVGSVPPRVIERSRKDGTQPPSHHSSEFTAEPGPTIRAAVMALVSATLALMPK